MFGSNAHLKQDLSDGESLHVQEIFYTLQGEGPYAGKPAVFVRLAGCNLACHFCDTEFESGLQQPKRSISSICSEIMVKFSDTITDAVLPEFAVITGGEPMRQNILPLMRELLARGVSHIQIETAGTLWFQETLSDADLRHLHRGQIEFICSPKTAKINPVLALNCHNWKYIVRSGEISDIDGLPHASTQIQGKFSSIYRPERTGDTIWLQPCEEHSESDNSIGSGILAARNKTHRNTQLAVSLSLRFGYRLCIQVHKVVGLK